MQADMEKAADVIADLMQAPLDALDKRLRSVEGITSAEQLRMLVHDAVEASLDALAARAAALVPVPAVENGKDGRDGLGVAGAMIDRDGGLIITLSDGTTRELGVVVGRDGEAGRDGLPGRDGKDGVNGKDGADGVGLAGAMIDRDGQLILTMTSGKPIKLGLVVGRDGKDGKDGADGPPGRDGVDGKDGVAGQPGKDGAAGMALRHFDSELVDDGRTLRLKLSDDERVETHDLPLFQMAYRGIFKDGSQYEVGDTVSFGGGLWHCNANTGERPGDGCNDWSLAVRRGRDGKSVTVDDVMPTIDAKLAEIEERLAKRVELAAKRQGL